MPYLTRLNISILLVIISASSSAQGRATDTTKYKTVSVRTDLLNRSPFYQKMWGRNRRAEWATPVTVPVLWLDTAYGGLKPIKTGGGNETRSLRLETNSGKQYTLRSINKSRADVVAPQFKNTFVEDIINDGISSSYPYGSFAVTEMQQQAGIYHTIPVLIYLPRQAALDTFNDRFGNDLYLFEQRLDGDWSDAANLGYFKDFSSTTDVIGKIQKDNKNIIDQRAYLKARLFDMLISDWDRHEDNWQWGERDSAGKTLFVPVPRDRDQAFYTHNGKLVDFLLPIAGLGFMQNFDKDVKSINTLNLEERYMDRFFSNEMGLDDWVNAAKSLQAALTDPVIERSVQQLPPEVFAVSGKELIEKLISRRDQLIAFSTAYYRFIAAQVEVIGSKEREYFTMEENGPGLLTVSVSRIDQNGQKENEPYYRRTFRRSETNEIRIYGIDGKDIYSLPVNSSGIVLRIIGGPAEDSIIGHGKNIHIYDGPSSDSMIHVYKYNGFEYDSKGINPDPFYNHEDRVYIGLNYGITKHKWRREPFASRHNIGINYSFTQHSLSGSYSALFPKRFLGFDLSFNINYDAARWANFYGLGNETISTNKNVDYYRMRNQEWLVKMGLAHTFRRTKIEFTSFYRRVNVRNDTGKYFTKTYPFPSSKLFVPNIYVGMEATYSYVSINDSIVPTRGFCFQATGRLVNNNTSHKTFTQGVLTGEFYLPLSRKFSLAIKAGGALIGADTSLLNTARVYQHTVIGGPESLRGYRTERFWGRSSFYNNNELRFITNLRTRLMTAKAGLMIFFDDGRVWMPYENSTTLHTSYGGGILLAPFHMVCFTFTYGISKEAKLFQLRLNTLF